MGTRWAVVTRYLQAQFAEALTGRLTAIGPVTIAIIEPCLAGTSGIYTARGLSTRKATGATVGIIRLNADVITAQANTGLSAAVDRFNPALMTAGEKYNPNNKKRVVTMIRQNLSPQ